MTTAILQRRYLSPPRFNNHVQIYQGGILQVWVVVISYRARCVSLECAFIDCVPLTGCF